MKQKLFFPFLSFFCYLYSPVSKLKKKKGRVTGPNQWPRWPLLHACVNKLTHACYNSKVINLAKQGKKDLPGEAAAGGIGGGRLADCFLLLFCFFLFSTGIPSSLFVLCFLIFYESVSVRIQNESGAAAECWWRWWWRLGNRSQLKIPLVILCGVVVLELHVAAARGKLAVLGLLKTLRWLGWKRQGKGLSRLRMAASGVAEISAAASMEDCWMFMVWKSC